MIDTAYGDQKCKAAYFWNSAYGSIGDFVVVGSLMILDLVGKRNHFYGHHLGYLDIFCETDFSLG